MQQSKAEKFSAERERLNKVVMKYASLSTKRFFSLDSQVYRQGALTTQTKEMLGLVASLVLRCDDCITYHVIRCHEEGLTDAELEEALSRRNRAAVVRSAPTRYQNGYAYINRQLCTMP